MNNSSDKHENSQDSGRLETIISWLLIAGVVMSLVLEITGIVLYQRQFGNIAISSDNFVFIHGMNFFTFIAGLFHPNFDGTSLLLMTAGLVVLMLTPFIRVLVSVIYFGRVKDAKYVLITLFVLVIITISLATH